MTRDDIERFLTRRARSWSDRDPDALAADHAEDSVIESPAHGRVTTRAAIRSAYATWFDAFPDLKLIHNDVLVEGDRAAVIFTSTGTHMKPFASIPASTRRVEIPGSPRLFPRDL